MTTLIGFTVLELVLAIGGTLFIAIALWVGHQSRVDKRE